MLRAQQQQQQQQQQPSPQGGSTRDLTHPATAAATTAAGQDPCEGLGRRISPCPQDPAHQGPAPKPRAREPRRVPRAPRRRPPQPGAARLPQARLLSAQAPGLS
nr:metacaspase-1-like [Penaeus vannamei]